MALNKAQFINSLTALFKEGFPTMPSDPDRRAEWQTMKDDIEDRAKAIAELIDDYITSGTVKVTIPPGTVAVGAGVAAAPNPVPITLTGSKASATGGVS